MLTGHLWPVPIQAGNNRGDQGYGQDRAGQMVKGEDCSVDHCFNYHKLPRYFPNHNAAVVSNVAIGISPNQCLFQFQPLDLLTILRRIGRERD